MIFQALYSDQFKSIAKNPTNTRSSKIILPTHQAIANIVKSNTVYNVISLPDKEYNFTSDLGNKKVDIAIVDDDNQLRGAIMFKAIRREYNKNSNNYYENMKGESSLFLDNNIPVYQIICIPTLIQADIKHGKITYEVPTKESYLRYCNFIANHMSYWDKLKLGVYYFDVNYDDNFATAYSSKIVPGVEPTITEGIINFTKEIN